MTNRRAVQLSGLFGRKGADGEELGDNLVHMTRGSCDASGIARRDRWALTVQRHRKSAACPPIEHAPAVRALLLAGPGQVMAHIRACRAEPTAYTPIHGTGRVGFL
jgi:hypothetical protein